MKVLVPVEIDQVGLTHVTLLKPFKNGQVIKVFVMISKNNFNNNYKNH